MSERDPADVAERDAFKSKLDQNVFLTAGAGAGKSTSLVKRVLATLSDQSRGVRIENIVAITFTERAAADLKHKLREGIAREVLNGNSALAVDLANVEFARIGTIHSFARSILTQFALEAKLPLGFVVSDEVQSRSAKVQRVRDAVAQVTNLADSESIFRRFDVSTQSLVDMVSELDSLSHRMPHDALKEVPQSFVDVQTEAARALVRIESLCSDSSDPLMAEINAKFSELMTLLTQSDDELIEYHLKFPKKLPCFSLRKGGKAANWTGDKAVPKDTWKALEVHLRTHITKPLVTAVWSFLNSASESLSESRVARQHAGELEFSDLLSFTRDLLLSEDTVRLALREQFKVILVDEFQDTDPVQYEILKLICAENGEIPEPGRLVVVGDGKQSIYSFTGADVATYSAALKEHKDNPLRGRVGELSVNFRSVPQIIDWVNRTFDPAFTGMAHQVEFKPLQAHRPALPEGYGPAVSILRGPIDAPTADAVTEARMIAQAIARAINEKWQVQDPDSVWRDVRLADIAVLYPTRTSLDSLLNELDRQGIAYRSTDSALVFDRPIISGIFHALSVISEPAQSVSLWFALKSPLFGCSDKELYEYRQSGASWLSLPVGEQAETKVGRALSLLYELSKWAQTRQPTDVIMRLCDETKVLEALGLSYRGQFDSDCVRMLLTHAHQWQNQGNVGLTAFVESLDAMQDSSSRASFTRQNNLDDDAIILSTIYGAKGLEYGVVFVAGMTTSPKSHLPKVALTGAHVEWRLSDSASSPGYQNWNDQVYSNTVAAEQMRVLYVACTRARDHLVVSMCGNSVRSGSPQKALESFIPTLSTDISWFEFVHVAQAQPAILEGVSSFWVSQLEAVRSDSTKTSVLLPSGSTAASALGLSTNTSLGVDAAVGVGFEPDESLALSTRDGAVFGQCVHRAMDIVMNCGNASHADISAAVDSAISELGVNLNAEEVISAVTALIDTDLLKEVLSMSRRWTELHLAAPVDHDGAVVVEGFADLVFQDSAGFYSVVDYKTDKTISAETLSHYRDQLATYAELIRRVTGTDQVNTFIAHVVGDSAEVIPLSKAQ